MAVGSPAPAGLQRFDDELMMPSQRLDLPIPTRPIERAKEAPEKISPLVGAPGPAASTGSRTSAKPELIFFPDIGGVDPMIAVGKDFVIVSEDHSIEFLYKTGAKAGKQLDSKAGEKTLLSSYDFFGGFFAPQNKDGSVNRNNINLHGRFPPASIPRWCACHGQSALPVCKEAYDTRVSTDPIGDDS